MKRRDEILKRIKRGRISRAHAAKALGVSERHVNRLMQAAGVARPASKRAEDRHARALEAAQWREHKARAALAVAAGQETLESAARRCRCSTRTLYRWLAKAKKSTKKRAK
jgi:hypothetical protein